MNPTRDNSYAPTHTRKCAIPGFCFVIDVECCRRTIEQTQFNVRLIHPFSGAHVLEVKKTVQSLEGAREMRTTKNHKINGYLLNEEERQNEETKGEQEPSIPIQIEIVI